MKKFLLGLLFTFMSITAVAQYSSEPNETKVGQMNGKYPLTLVGLQHAIASIDSGVVYVAYPGLTDTTGLGAIPSNIYLQGWYQGNIMRNVIFETDTSHNVDETKIIYPYANSLIDITQTTFRLGDPNETSYGMRLVISENGNGLFWLGSSTIYFSFNPTFGSSGIQTGNIVIGDYDGSGQGTKISLVDRGSIDLYVADTLKIEIDDAEATIDIYSDVITLNIDSMYSTAQQYIIMTGNDYVNKAFSLQTGAGLMLDLRMDGTFAMPSITKFLIGASSSGSDSLFIVNGGGLFLGGLKVSGDLSVDSNIKYYLSSLNH